MLLLFCFVVNQTLVDGNVLPRGGGEFVDRYTLIGGVGGENRTGAAKHFVLEAGEMRRIAAKCHGCRWNAFYGEEARWGVAAKGFDADVLLPRLIAFSNLGEGVHNKFIRRECGAEIEAERQLVAEYVLRVVACKLTYVPSGFALKRVDGEVDAAQVIDKINKEVDSRYTHFGVSRMAAFAADCDLERFCALGCAHHAVVGGLANQQIFCTGMGLCKMLSSERAGFFAGKQQQPESGVASTLKFEASLIERP